MKNYFVETHAGVRGVSVEIAQNIVEMGQKIKEFEVLETIQKEENLSQSI